MNIIEMIGIRQLHHHPENPRKDLGDLTELAESIKANGIMQNLTVVPDPARNGMIPPQYLVVIGNRRMEAAKIAGLEEVPCVISDMDHRTQIATMLEENMQRADLTVYEQAQGFQMMMDLGFTQKEISEKTGFSETTVSRRLKMAELDKEKFKKAVGKQISMDDLDRLGQLDSVKQRNELLAEYGGNNFDWKLNRAIKVQQAEKVRPAALKMIEAYEPKLKKIPTEDRYKLWNSFRQLHTETLELDKWDGKSSFIPKTDDQLYYVEDGTDILFWVKEKKEKKETEQKTPEQIEREKKIQLAWKTVERVNETAYELREKYATGLKVTPKNAMEMLQWTLTAALTAAQCYDTPTSALRKEIPLTTYDRQTSLGEIRDWIMNMSQYKWPELILRFFHGEGKPVNQGWAEGNRYDYPKYAKNARLEQCYEWLTQFGYQMSDEEIRMMRGSHECFGKEGAGNE